MSDEVKEATASCEAVQDLIDSAELLKRLHDDILTQVKRFDELAEKIASRKAPVA